MKTVAGIATHPGRETTLAATVASLQNQVDQIIIYDNSKAPDRADNGKFVGLMACMQMSPEPVYYFSCDDDLIYQCDYVANMKAAIDRFGGIVTLHGRILTGTDRNYYWDHTQFRFFQKNPRMQVLDVPGTGVTAFRTDYFNPLEIIDDERLCMSDLLFARIAAEQKKVIRLLEHSGVWAVQQEVPREGSILGKFLYSCEQQSDLADQIYNILYDERGKRRH